MDHSILGGDKLCLIKCMSFKAVTLMNLFLFLLRSQLLALSAFLRFKVGPDGKIDNINSLKVCQVAKGYKRNFGLDYRDIIVLKISMRLQVCTRENLSKYGNPEMTKLSEETMSSNKEIIKRRKRIINNYSYNQQLPSTIMC